MPARFEPSITVVVPAYNERENLPKVVGELVALVRRRCRHGEILVVDDGSTDGDGSGSFSDGAGAPELRMIAHPENRGLTQALRTGFQAASTELVTWAPADGQIPASEIERMIDAWRGEDLLLTTYHHRPDGVTRAAMSLGLRLLYRAVVGLRDRLEGPYLFRTALYRELELVARGGAAGSVGFEIAAKARTLGRSIGSLEIACAPRLSGRSKVANARNIGAALGELWRIGASVRQLRRR